MKLVGWLVPVLTNFCKDQSYRKAAWKPIHCIIINFFWSLQNHWEPGRCCNGRLNNWWSGFWHIHRSQMVQLPFCGGSSCIKGQKGTYSTKYERIKERYMQTSKLFITPIFRFFHAKSMSKCLDHLTLSNSLWCIERILQTISCFNYLEFSPGIELLEFFHCL